jgi:eukaryotic-like serine/threonine-protein kinase
MMGQMFSHYRILEKLGAGGMGVVYRAHDERLNRDVALKILPTETISSETDLKRLHQEALVLSRLSHPHSAQVNDFDAQNGIAFLVMEYIRGLSESTPATTCA